MLGYGIKETTTTSGAGTLTLSSVSGFPRFSDVFSVGTPVAYSLLDGIGQPVEAGYGTVGSGNTLTRERVMVTFAGGVYNDLTPSAVSLTGTTTVICTPLPSSFASAIPNVNTVQTYSGSAAQRVVMDTRLNFGSTGNIILSGNKLYLVPFKLDVDCIATGIAMRIVTGAAGKSIRAGLYRLDHQGFPAELVDETDSTAAATTGVNWSASFAANQRLMSGMYVIGFVSDGTPAIGSASSHLLFGPVGILTGNSYLAPSTYNYGPHTYGALPATPPTAVTAGSTQHPAVGLTIA